MGETFRDLRFKDGRNVTHRLRPAVQRDPQGQPTQARGRELHSLPGTQPVRGRHDILL